MRALLTKSSHSFQLFFCLRTSRVVDIAYQEALRIGIRVIRYEG